MKNDIISVIENSKCLHPIIMAKIKGNRYWDDFLAVNEDYKKILSEREYADFLKKSKLDCKISEAQYLQFASEATIVDYVIRNYSNFKNEPKYNQKKNPECSFEYEGRTVNIEVKCPDLFKRMEQENFGGIKVFAGERFPDKDSFIQVKQFIESNIKNGERIQNVDRLDNKLKDYLISANEKFPISDLSNFNILVIAVDIVQDMDEWYSYLFGDNGAFTDKTYIVEDYDNVDAVMLTNVQHGHMADDVDLSTNCWKLENYSSLLLLNPQKQLCNRLGEYYEGKALDLFGGTTRSFLKYQDNLERDKVVGKLNLNSELYIEDKITNLQIISEWVKTLENNQQM